MTGRQSPRGFWNCAMVPVALGFGVLTFKNGGMALSGEEAVGAAFTCVYA